MAARQENPAQRYEEAVRSFNGHDIGEMLQHCVPDVVVHEHGQQREVEGHGQVREWLTWWLEAFPDATMEMREAPLAAGAWSITQFTIRGTNRGRLGPYPPTHRRAEVEVCSLAHWQNGQLVEEHWYYDLYGLLAQLGHVSHGPEELTRRLH